MRIKQQRKSPDWEYEVVCENCNTVYILENENDMYAKSQSKAHTVDFGKLTYHCKCPRCDTEANVNPKCIRNDIKFKIKLKN